jgi:hypothetical protein
MRIALLSAACLGVGVLSAGCTIYREPAPAYQPAYDQPVDEGPVVEGPGVVIIETEPPPAERVYVYDPGYPPGVYFYNNYYWYGGYRYDRDVFRDRYVERNIREHRYVDANENRAEGHRFEEQHRQEYARTGGVRPQRENSPSHRGGAAPGQTYRPEPRSMSPRPGGEQPTREMPSHHTQQQPPAQRPRPRPEPNQNGPKQQGGRNEQQ